MSTCQDDGSFGQWSVNDMKFRNVKYSNPLVLICCFRPSDLTLLLLSPPQRVSSFTEHYISLFSSVTGKRRALISHVITLHLFLLPSRFTG